MAKQKMIIGAICLLLAPVVARATTVRRMDTAHLTRVSNLIVEGTVVDNKVVYDDGPNGPMNVRTITTVQVSRALKGQTGETVSVVGRGGVVGDLSYNWPGVPRFSVGDKALLFLYTEPNGYLSVTGLEQGRLNVRVTPNGDEIVQQNIGDLQIVGPAPDATKKPVAGRHLDNVIDEIAQLVELEAKPLRKDGGR